MNHCTECFSRLDACDFCITKGKELEAKDAEIAALSANNKGMGIERFELINEIARLRRALEDIGGSKAVLMSEELGGLVNEWATQELRMRMRMRMGKAEETKEVDHQAHADITVGVK